MNRTRRDRRRKAMRSLDSWRKRRLDKIRKRFGIVMLDIPLVSQLNVDEDWNYVKGAEKYGNDCGPAVVSMIVEAIFGTKVTVNHIFELIQKKDKYTSIGQLMGVLFYNFGIPNTREAGKKIEDYIDEGRGIIALILYSEIQKEYPNKYSGFGDLHFVGFRGYKKNKEGKVTHYYMLDPLRPFSWLRINWRKIKSEVVDRSWAKARPVRTAIVTEKGAIANV